MEWMGYGVGIIGILVGVTGITLFLLSQKEVKSLIEQLEKFKSNPTNQEIRLRGGNKLCEQLAIKINETLREKKRLQSEYIKMDRQLREAVANISHDLRTPLTSIMGYVQLLEQEHLIEDKRNQYLKIIKGRAENLKSLIESFYELSKLESEDYTICCEEIHLERIFCELVANFYQDFVDKNLEIQMNIEENLPSIWADEKATTRILLNLIQNALRYAKKNIEVNISQEEERVKIQIANEAGELKAEDVPHLFDRFFMVNRVRNGEGTGVGLAVVKKLVAMINGKVDARLVENQLIIGIYFNKYKNK
ncbi:MAG: HAMP domain-containing histidine kinase [Cellulosilyticum sp.]|nr:HAMP domain-containing histidine kinase [Cellulosilyticum sp.]